MTERIERIDLFHLQVPFKEAFRAAAASVPLRDTILVSVETAQGRIGLGECSPGPVGSAALVERCWAELVDRIAPSVLGWEIASPEGIAELASSWRGASPSAVASVETPCWDLLSQLHSVSLCRLLGAPTERIALGVESGLTVGLHRTVVDLLRAVEPHMEEGYKRLKLVIAPGYDIEFVRALRLHFGDLLPLMVDGAGSYRREDKDALVKLDDEQLLMIEQPLPANDIEGLAMLQAAIATPVCLAATADSVARVSLALQRGAGRIVELRLQNLGGYGPALAVHSLCRDLDVACYVGATAELGVGQAHGLHLATLANCRYPSDIQPSARWFMEDCVAPRIEMAGPGRIEVPDRPGLGFRLDPDSVRRHQVRHTAMTTQA